MALSINMPFHDLDFIDDETGRLSPREYDALLAELQGDVPNSTESDIPCIPNTVAYPLAIS